MVTTFDWSVLIPCVAVSGAAEIETFSGQELLDAMQAALGRRETASTGTLFDRAYFS